MSSNQYLIDAASRHAVFLQRYSAGLEKQAADKVSDALAGLIADFSNDQSTISMVRNYSGTLEDLEQQLYDEFIALAESEAEFDKELFESSMDADINPVPPSRLSRAIDSMDMEIVRGQRVTVPSMLSSFTRAKTAQITNIIDAGFAQGRTQDQVIKDLRKVEPMQRSNAATIARTGTNAVSAISRMEMMAVNLDILEGFEIVGTLDNRTSKICMGLDGNIIKFGAGSGEFVGRYGEISLYYSGPSIDFLRITPFPPYHFSCRTTLIPKVDPKYDLGSEVEGVRPSVGPDGAKQVGARTTYSGWLRKQPATFQNEALGPARAKLFRQGGLGIDKFVNYDGRTYSLEELRGLYPMAFEKANI